MTRTIAYYLPQFHRIPENDRWWGEGFTEWENVRRAEPQFAGHRQPRTTARLGEYDLTDPSVRAEQTVLARSHGVDAFCMYFYWFDGRRLLEGPLEAWRCNPSLLPYCLSWANENWTRRWDGKSRDVLMAQNYRPGYEDAIFAELLPHFEAPHYLRQAGRPILVVHRADLIPDSRKFSRRLNGLASDAGVPGLYLVAAETKPGLNPSRLGFDAVAEFPPVGTNTLSNAQLAPIAGLNREFRGRLLSYSQLSAYYVRRSDSNFIRHPGVTPGWDNTARRQSHATIYVGATPGRYLDWLSAARQKEEKTRGTEGLVFINAWNEWAEGAYLEPDRDLGDAYLQATKAAVQAESVRHGGAGLWSWPQIRSLVLTAAGSALSGVRRLRNRLR